MQIHNIGSANSFPLKPQAARTASESFAEKLSQAAKTTTTAADDKKLRETCREMESVFLNYLLTQMRSTVHKTNLFGDNSKQEIVQSLLDSELSKNMAGAGGIGLADMIYRQLSTQQTKSQAPK